MAREAAPKKTLARKTMRDLARREIRPRTVRVGQRRTSLRLEPEFWAALGEIAAVEMKSVPQIFEQIEKAFGTRYFASTIRVFVLSHFQNRGHRKDSPKLFAKRGTTQAVEGRLPGAAQ